MSLEMNKWAEHGHLLHEHARHLHGALYCAQRLLDSPGTGGVVHHDLHYRSVRPDVLFTTVGGEPLMLDAGQTREPTFAKPRLLTDPLFSGVVKALTKKFPDLQDVAKAKDFPAFSAHHEELMVELKPFYEMLVDTAEFLETSVAHLLQVNGFVNWSAETTYDLAVSFMHAVNDYMIAVYLLANVPNVKAIVGGYAKCVGIGYGSPDIQFGRLARMISSVERPQAYLVDALSQVAPRIASTMMDLKPLLDFRIATSANTFRLTGILALIPELLGIKAAETTERQLLGLADCRSLFQFMILGTLAAPTEIAHVPALADLVRTAVGYAYNLPLVRNQMLPIVPELELMAKAHSKTSKFKNSVVEVLANQAACNQFHKERRAYLVLQLRQIHHLCSEPSLIAQKLPIIVAAMGFAREEVMWYFAHGDLEQTQRKRSKKDTRAFDLTVIELLWLVMQIRRVIVAHEARIKEGLAAEVASTTAPHATAVLEGMFGTIDANDADPASALVRAIMVTLEKLRSGHVAPLASTKALAALRLDWQRLQVMAILPSSQMSTAYLPELGRVMGVLCSKSLWFDRFHATLDHYTRFAELCFYQTSLQEHLRDAIENEAPQMRFLAVLGRVGEHFSANASALWPGEMVELNAQTQAYFGEILTVIGTFAAQHAHQLALLTMQNQTQVHARESHVPTSGAALPAVTAATAAGMVGTGAGEDVLLRPGHESSFHTALPEVQQLQRTRHALTSLVHALVDGGNAPLRAGDVAFRPASYLIAELETLFRGWLSANLFRTTDPAEFQSGYVAGSKVADKITPDDGCSFDMKRPSLYLAELRGYLAAVRALDALLDLDVTAYLRQVYLDESSLQRAMLYTEQQRIPLCLPMVVPYGKKLPSARTKLAASNPPPTTQPLLVTLMQWYTEFAGTKSGGTNIVFSPARQCFISRGVLGGAHFRAEHYTDRAELTALCTLIGPLGVKFMDEKLVRMVAQLGAGVKESLTANAELLTQLHTCWENETRAADVLKKLRGPAELARRLVALGFLLSFRTLLSDALAATVDQRCGFIAQTILRAEDATYASPAVLNERPSVARAVSAQANLVGRVDRMDCNVRWALNSLVHSLQSDASVWTLLPIALAATVHHIAGEDPSVYHDDLEAYENNNHTLALAYTTL
ncbi:hypothetical protein CXG81DRAFT_13916, partial [Caulochytrium protostelioides]